jgi:Holliday junction resolvasome RuvABC endonuclease subunit
MLWSPDYVALEYPADMKNANTARTLIGYYNALLMLCDRMDIESIELRPSQIKKMVTGDGRAHKDKVAEVICELLHLEPQKVIKVIHTSKAVRKPIKNYLNPKDDKPVKEFLYDETDAIAIAYCGWRNVKHEL